MPPNSYHKKIEEWATKNKIKINKGNGKSHIMYVNRRKTEGEIYTIANIKPTIKYKYLGITLQYNGKFTTELPNIRKKITSF